MGRFIAGLATLLLGTSPVWAGELDRDCTGPKGKAINPGDKVLSPSKATGLQTLLPSNGKDALGKGSELDEESPTQAYRVGGWGRGWGGWGRGWGGWGWGRGWYGYRGWGWGWGGWRWGWPYYARAWAWGWPNYAGLWRPYVGYGYGAAYADYPYSDYCW